MRAAGKYTVFIYPALSVTICVTYDIDFCQNFTFSYILGVTWRMNIIFVNLIQNELYFNFF